MSEPGSFEQLSKADLHELADRLLQADAQVIETAVAYFASETEGPWHNRARALLARRFKHVDLTQAQRRRIVDVVNRRLLTGHFSEQFADQLRLARHLDLEATRIAARAARESDKPHVQRYGCWLEDRLDD